MTAIKWAIDFFLHIDEHLADIIAMFGLWSYAILFGVIFVETGLVIMPFLPGDSLLFASGALTASLGVFNIWLLWVLMMVAAVVGDTVNYWIGHSIGAKAFDPNFTISVFGRNFKVSKVLKPEYMEKAQGFYDKHGGKAIILARFVPIVRTFAPFVAGVGKMNYSKFISFNVIGGVAWVSAFLWGGYFFGNLPIIKDNFHYSVVIIILVSVVPILMEVVKSRREARLKK
jgi:membrane-associated protein